MKTNLYCTKVNGGFGIDALLWKPLFTPILRHRTESYISKESAVSIRLVVQMQTRPEHGDEFFRLAAQRCRTVENEQGCEQFEVFRSALNPTKFTLLILWHDQASLDAHNALAKTQTPGPWGTLVDEPSVREDYIYNRTR
jgi:quinol monooxygenase YgiN